MFYIGMSIASNLGGGAETGEGGGGGDRVGIVGILFEKNVLYGSGRRNGGAFLHWKAQCSSALAVL